MAEICEDSFDNGFNDNMNLITGQDWFGFRPSVRFEEGYPGEAWQAVPGAITTRNHAAAENGQDRIGATLREQPQKYIAHSAVMFADRIDTPLLMLSGEGDWNVPATNQREMCHALRRLGKEVGGRTTPRAATAQAGPAPRRTSSIAGNGCSTGSPSTSRTLTTPHRSERPNR